MAATSIGKGDDDAIVVLDEKIRVNARVRVRCLVFLKRNLHLTCRSGQL